jgi:NADH-quinone oxidoreductase subunit B
MSLMKGGLKLSTNPDLPEELQGSVFTSKLGEVIKWAQKFSLFQYPFVTACCGMEFFSVAAGHHDIARFGAEVPRFSPRQADVMWVVGTITQKQAPILQRVYEQMAEPKWVIAFGVCASTGGFYDNYATVPGIDRLIPVDVYIPGCPPRPEQIMDGLMRLQDKIQREPCKSLGSASKAG